MRSIVIMYGLRNARVTCLHSRNGERPLTLTSRGNAGVERTVYDSEHAVPRQPLSIYLSNGNAAGKLYLVVIAVILLAAGLAVRLVDLVDRPSRLPLPADAV